MQNRNNKGWHPAGLPQKSFLAVSRQKNFRGGPGDRTPVLWRFWRAAAGRHPLLSRFWRTKPNQSGYIALLAVLIIGTAATAISLVLLTTGSDSQRTALITQQSKQARVLAAACAQEALQQIHDNIALSGTNSVSLGQGSCTYTITVTAATTRSIAVTGTINNVIKKLQVYVTIGSSSISVSSWQEVS